jgi:cyclopropane fatty-acyl-phospholipid synthase-like methyltransferase
MMLYHNFNMKNKLRSIDFETGVWTTPNVEHCFDLPLVEEIANFFKRKDAKHIYDIGCGSGDYTFFLREAGLSCSGFDGNPFTRQDTNGVCEVMNFAIPQALSKADYILCLEMGEHVPKQYEDIVIQNLHNSNARGIILSWAIPGQGGEGHFNEQSNQYIKSIFAGLGYINNLEEERILRDASTLPWFKNTIMVFEKTT